MGLSRDLGETHDPTKSAHTQGIGTIGYRAPEVYKDGDNKSR